VFVGWKTNVCDKTVFEDKELADKAVIAVEKEIHRDVSIDGSGAGSKEVAVHAEEAKASDTSV